ncbi:tyrosine-type recombinase/integrase [Ligilactobacillus agilis]|uniref:tyrosine-type recombinase/integrase n=1 Tax=Ligilactobacillus agilis TaxID=1601 RepID=UPI0034E2EAC9
MTKIIKYSNAKNETRYKFRYYAGLDELTGKKRYIKKAGFANVDDAKKELLKLEYLNSIGELTRPIKNIKFGELLTEWMQLYKTTVKPSTYASAKRKVRKYIMPYFGDMYANKITLQQCQAFTNKVYSLVPVASSSINSIIKRVLDYAIRLGIRDNNPMQYVIRPKRQPSVPDTSRHPNFYDRKELAKFLNTAKELSLKYYALFRLLAFSGIRIGELSALTWQDLNFKTKELNINKTLAVVERQKTIQTPKSKAGTRLISLDDETVRILKTWQLRQRKDFLKLGINTLGNNQLIFSNDSNDYLSNSVVKNWLLRVSSRAHLPRITVHGFRHTHASLLFASGVDAKQVQTRLGHANINITLNIYTHVTKEQQSNLGDAFANYVNLGS